MPQEKLWEAPGVAPVSDLGVRKSESGADGRLEATGFPGLYRESAPRPCSVHIRQGDRRLREEAPTVWTANRLRRPTHCRSLRNSFTLHAGATGVRSSRLRNRS